MPSCPSRKRIQPWASLPLLVALFTHLVFAENAPEKLSATICATVAAEESDSESCRDFQTLLSPTLGQKLGKHFELPGSIRLIELEQLTWLPTEHTPNSAITFHTKGSQKVSAPWPLLERSNTSTTYRLTESPSDWDGRIALGKMQQEQLLTPGATARVSILDSEPGIHEQELMQWLQEGIDAISSIYGQFPLASVQILVTPVGESRGSVPWGQVTRGGFPAVHLFVDQTDPYPVLLDDWTLFHELSHLFIPLVERGGMWLPEGLASYYQTVTRARAGLIDETTAWRKLLGGMQNGIEQADNRRRFEDVLARRNWSNIRLIYWTGAAIFLKADIALRTMSDNRQSLDWVLGEFQRCCLPSYRVWEAQELLEKFDQLVGAPVFVPLAHANLQRRGFPDIGNDLSRLGVLRSADGSISLAPAAPLVEVRREIMRARQED